MRELTHGELRRVLGHYRLGELTNAQRAESGFVNQNWVLETTCGSFFLKCRHPDLRHAGVIHAQHALIETLRRKAFPAPSIVPTAAGDTLLVLEGDFLEIQACIEHTQYDHQRMAHFDVAARTLARYHECVEGFTSATLQDLGELYSPAIVRKSFTNLVTVWELAGDPAMAGIARQLEVHAADLESCFARHGELPHLVIHGDYYADNLLYCDDRIVGVVDYDKARWQPRVAELAEALIYFASPRPGRLHHLVYPAVLQWEPFSRFLHHYAGGIDLAEEEAHALPDYIRAIWLSVSLQRLAETDRRPSDAEDDLAELLALADWAKDNSQRMSEVGLFAMRP